MDYSLAKSLTRLLSWLIHSLTASQMTHWFTESLTFDVTLRMPCPSSGSQTIKLSLPVFCLFSYSLPSSSSHIPILKSQPLPFSPPPQPASMQCMYRANKRADKKHFEMFFFCETNNFSNRKHEYFFEKWKRTKVMNFLYRLKIS